METKLNTQNESKYKDEKVLSPSRVVWNRLRRDKLAIAGLVILGIIFAAVIFGPIISPYKDAITTGSQESWHDYFLEPNAQHWLGTDSIGRDILTRLLWGGRVSLAIGIVGVLFEILLGTILGAVAGYYGGAVDWIIMRIVDVMMSIPFLPILISLGAILSDLHFPPSTRIFMIMIILGLLDWPGLARLVRGQILTLREQEFMIAAEALGLRDRRKIFKHLIPNTIPIIIVSATLSIAGNILLEAMMSFLNLGVQPPLPSWGNMIQEAQNFYNMQYRSFLWIPPGLCIFLTTMAINLFGDGLRDALDPKLKR